MSTRVLLSVKRDGSALIVVFPSTATTTQQSIFVTKAFVNFIESIKLLNRSLFPNRQERRG